MDVYLGVSVDVYGRLWTGTSGHASSLVYVLYACVLRHYSFLVFSFISVLFCFVRLDCVRSSRLYALRLCKEWLFPLC